MNCFEVGIEVSPTPPPPPPPPKQTIPAKLLAIMRKYKFNWRIVELAKPKPAWMTQKYVYKVETPLRYTKTELPPLWEETKYYSDQQARPRLRTVVINKGLFSPISSKRHRKNFRKTIKNTWASIYNFYKKRERDRRRRKERREREAMKDKKKKKIFDRTGNLAQPKRVFKRPPPKKAKKIFKDYDYLEGLAAPKHFIIEPPKPEGVSAAAMIYLASDIIFKLSQIPERWLNIPKPLTPGKVSRAALKYKLTPRTQTLATPRAVSEKTKEDDGYDPFTISPSALKYKATPRILELAKPKERD